MERAVLATRQIYHPVLENTHPLFRPSLSLFFFLSLAKHLSIFKEPILSFGSLLFTILSFTYLL